MKPGLRLEALRRRFAAWCLALLGWVFAGSIPALATTVEPPEFSALVARAGSVFRGEVTGLRSELVERGGDRAIFTYVTFRVTELIRGKPLPTEVTLEFLGGTVGDLTLEVAGMPRFERGAQEIVFVERAGPQICPLVAMAYGRYRVLRDAAGAEQVARDNGAPLMSTADVSLPLTAPAIVALNARRNPAGARPLTPADFSQAIRAEALRARLP